MKPIILETQKTIQSNSTNLHNYFGWPTVARLKDGRLCVGSSGFRLSHLCPFGKGVLSFSSDEGETWSKPQVVIDTALDDRDVGLCPFGESGLIVTSFNNSVKFQRRHANVEAFATYRHAYLDNVTEEMEEKSIGSLFTVSFDNGTTFGELYKSPITSPHGPLALSDGSFLWVGRPFSEEDRQQDGECIRAYRLSLDGSMEYRGSIENVTDEYGAPLFVEPHAIELPNGNILCHIRAHRYVANPVFTIYQSVSSDKGKTWSKPVMICESQEGAPPHLMFHSSGTLICSYGHREAPFGIRVGISNDNGTTWAFGHVLSENFETADLGYASTVELNDSSLLTVFYAKPAENKPAEIMQIKWKLES